MKKIISHIPLLLSGVIIISNTYGTINHSLQASAAASNVELNNFLSGESASSQDERTTLPHVNLDFWLNYDDSAWQEQTKPAFMRLDLPLYTSQNTNDLEEDDVMVKPAQDEK